MKVREVLQKIYQIHVPKNGYPVERTVASELIDVLRSDVTIEQKDMGELRSKTGVFNIAVADEEIKQKLKSINVKLPVTKEWVFFDIDENQCCWLLSSKPNYLYLIFSYIIENRLESDISENKNQLQEVSFAYEKSTFDLFLTQYARLVRNFQKEQYIREYARLGFTHIEVNALAASQPHERGVPGEFYPDFYTYCPALDQFVSSKLNQGIYPSEYLEANLNLLKEKARLAVKYGLTP